MRESIKIFLISIGIILFSNESVGKAFLYAAALFCVLQRKKDLASIGIISVIFDLYHSLPVGITFVTVMISVLITEKFQAILNIFPFATRVYYLFSILLITETANYMFTELAGGNFNFYSHLLVMVKAITLYITFEILNEYKIC